jgi:ring-1,2-phenylacetyl-CoA epoxidase subunit PaaC
VQPSTLREDFDRLTGEVLAEAELAGEYADGGLGLERIPQSLGGGRRGKHSEHLGYVLAEMQVLAREHPGAGW